MTTVHLSEATFPLANMASGSARGERERGVQLFYYYLFRGKKAPLAKASPDEKGDKVTSGEATAEESTLMSAAPLLNYGSCTLTMTCGTQRELIAFHARQHTTDEAAEPFIARSVHLAHAQTATSHEDECGMGEVCPNENKKNENNMSKNITVNTAIANAQSQNIKTESTASTMTSQPRQRAAAEPTKPQLVLGGPLDELTKDILKYLPKGALFNIAGEYCRVSVNRQGESSIRKDAVSATGFRTWISQYVTFVTPKGAAISIDTASAKEVMESYLFSEAVPTISQISSRQLAYGKQDAKGKWTFTPTKQGYDERTQAYTADADPIDWEHPMPVAEAVEFINRQFQECQFDDKLQAQEKSSGMGIVVAMMLGQFLRFNIKHFPICIAEANRPGAGKTFLIQTMLAPFYGATSSESFPQGEEKQERSLVSHARAGKGYCFYDNVQCLKSNVIEQAVTSSVISYNRMYCQETGEIKAGMQFFVTGNNLVTREDTDRRSRRIMLFNGAMRHNRAYKNIISEDCIQSPAWQKKMLEALWGLVHGWQEAGCPDMNCQRLASFGDWRALAGNITVWAGWAAPCVSQVEKGDSREAAFIEVIQNMVAEMPANGNPCELSINNIIDAATRMDSLVEILCDQHPAKAAYICQQFKNKLLKVYLRDTRGREFCLKEERISVNGTRPRRLRVYFSEVDAPAFAGQGDEDAA